MWSSSEGSLIETNRLRSGVERFALSKGLKFCIGSAHTAAFRVASLDVLLAV